MADTSKLQAARDAVVKSGIGAYLETQRALIAAIDEHIAADAESAPATDSMSADTTALQEQVADLQARLDSVVKVHAAELAEAKKLQSVQVEQSVIDEALAYQKEHNIEPK